MCRTSLPYSQGAHVELSMATRNGDVAALSRAGVHLNRATVEVHFVCHMHKHMYTFCIQRAGYVVVWEQVAVLHKVPHVGLYIAV